MKQDNRQIPEPPDPQPCNWGQISTFDKLDN